MCSNLKESKLNALRITEIESTEEPKTLTVIYGPYMNWGKWNANTTRIEVFLKMLLENNMMFSGNMISCEAAEGNFYSTF